MHENPDGWVKHSSKEANKNAFNKPQEEKLKHQKLRLRSALKDGGRQVFQKVKQKQQDNFQLHKKQIYMPPTYGAGGERGVGFMLLDPNLSATRVLAITTCTDAA